MDIDIDIDLGDIYMHIYIISNYKHIQYYYAVLKT